MKILIENWRSYRKQLLNEESKFSNELSDMDNKDQRLRNLFAKEIKNAGGWSQELVNQFAKKHGTAPDDIFDSKSVMNDFVKLFPQLDFSNFDEKDWNNFNTLILHERRPEHLKMRKKALSIMIKENFKDWKGLAADMARTAGLFPELEGIQLDLDGDTKDGGRVDLLLKKKNMTWEQLVNKLGVKI